MKKKIKNCYENSMKYCSGYFTQLLFSLILLIIFRPYDRGYIYLAIWDFLLILVFSSAIFNCDHSKKIKIISTSLAIPSLLFEWLNLLYPQKAFILLSLLFMIIFVFVTTGSIIMRVVINARVRLETLKGVVCAYFMMGMGFSFTYLLIDIISPGSFHFSNLDPTIITHSHYLSELMYFSFVTLLCIGYGDMGIWGYDCGVGCGTNRRNPGRDCRSVLCYYPRFTLGGCLLVFRAQTPSSHCKD